jgi:dTDP-4-amino-4,6-dideoxygalactose transaminase
VSRSRSRLDVNESWILLKAVLKSPSTSLSHFPLEEIASKRRANYCYLLERVSQIEGVKTVFTPLPPDVVPWVLPLTIGDRCEMDIEMRTLGIPAVTWVSVRDPRISSQEFPEADFLYECLVLLPIHQDLERPQLDLIAEAVRTVCRTGQDQGPTKGPLQSGR